MPTYLHFLAGAVLGACTGVWVRVFGGLVLNNFVDWPHFQHFFLGSLLVPTLSLYALATYVAVGTPIFFWARRRLQLKLVLFLTVGTIVGYLASFPALLLPSWAAMYSLSGLASGLVGFATMWALTRRSTWTRAIKPPAPVN